MEDKLKELYIKYQIPEKIIINKIEMFDRHPDIKSEFEHWIDTGKYLDEDYVEINGYSAKSISGMSKYMNGEGAFVMLIKLRENPDEALKQINSGFKKI